MSRKEVIEVGIEYYSQHTRARMGSVLEMHFIYVLIRKSNKPFAMIDDIW
jgi:hypothetical protein